MSKMRELQLAYSAAKQDLRLKKANCNEERKRSIIREILRDYGIAPEEEWLATTYILKQLLEK